MKTVSLLLEGQSPSAATPELVNLAKKIRTGMDDVWGLLAKTQKVTGGFSSSDGVQLARARPFTLQEAPRYLRDYLPHIPLYGNESTLTLSGTDALKKLMSSKQAQMFDLAKRSPLEVWTPDASGRLGSHFGRYQEFMQRVGAQVFNPRLFKRSRTGIRLQSQEGEGLFETDLNIILQKYFHSAARTYALNTPVTALEQSLVRTSVEGADGIVRFIRPSREPIIVQIINEGLGAAGPLREIQRSVRGTNVVERFLDPRSLNAPTVGALRTLVREVKGMSDTGEILFGNLFNTIRHKASTQLGSILGKKGMDNLEASISHVQRDAHGADLSRRVTSYFYASTLGLNTASSLKNLMQPFLTTMPTIGVGATLKGYGVLRQRMPLYANSFMRNRQILGQNPRLNAVQKINLAQEKAFHEAFPELAASGIKADPRAFELSEAALVRDISRTGKVRSVDDYFKLMLQPFTQAELSNQVVTFYGGKERLKQMMRVGELDIPRHVQTQRALSGAEMDSFLNLEASNLVNMTQFRPGAGSRSVLQTMIPPPFRMFTSFPLRLGNLMADSTVRGALTDAQMKEAGLFARLTGGRNYGTLARTYLFGRTVNEGLREVLGVDMSDALGISGPFTGIVESGKIASPLTFSPLPGVVMGMASFTSSRDLKDLKPLSLPVVGDIPIPKTLVPGGVQISRMSKAARAFRPDLGGFVDEDERLMYEGDTPDAILGMLGVPLEKERRMREAMDRNHANVNRVRQLRRRYATASMTYDFDTMDSLDRQYQEEFPGVGPLTLSRKDLARYRESARMTATQRTLKALGRTMGFLAEQDLYRHDPDLVADEPVFDFAGLGGL
jgi:hypothetical protein